MADGDGDQADEAAAMDELAGGNLDAVGGGVAAVTWKPRTRALWPRSPGR